MFLIILALLVISGEEHYQLRGENALRKMKEWSRHSAWNFENKLLLIEAECYNCRREFEKAALCYEASIKSAREHKFDPDEAIANELAGIFFYQTRSYQKKNYLKSHMFFLQSIQCYKRWGANAAARRVKDSMGSKFDRELMSLYQTETTTAVTGASKEATSKKRQLDKEG